MEDQAARSEIKRWHTIYSHLLETERHWTAQVQNQQQRVSTILSVNGFLLGFLASAGFSEAFLSRDPWPRYLFLASLIVLSLALMMGILSLMPGIPISKPAKGQPPEPSAVWLDSAAVIHLTEKVPEDEALRELAKSLKESQVNADYARVLRVRRLLMYCHLTLLLYGLVLLVAALIAFQVSGR